MRIRAGWLLVAVTLGVQAQSSFDADVVVLSDTSASMEKNDPQNAIVLVTRLFADIVPGKLAVVRLFETGRDKDKVPMRDSGKTSTCEGRSGPCQVFEFGPGAAEKVINDHILVKVRPSRGDTGFKAGLQDFLQPLALDTHYALPLMSVDRVFKDNASPESMGRFVVWLSDGAADAGDREEDERLLRDMTEKGIVIRPVVFKTGSTEMIDKVGLKASLVDSSPRSIMSAFADAFRAIVEAPFRADGTVAGNPDFVIKPHMEDVWVVVYGNESLASANVSGNGQTAQADYASDQYRGSAYRVAYMKNPAPGNWKVTATGGGVEVSYAVIQRSTIAPNVVVPPNVFTGVPFKLDATLRTSSGADLQPGDLPEPVKMEATFDGQTVPLNDTAANGHFITMMTASHSGQISITVRAHNSFIDKNVKVTVNASGYFRYHGGPVVIDFGLFKAGGTVCRPLAFEAEQEGAVPFELRPTAALPQHVNFELRGNGKTTSPGAPPIALVSQDAKQICIITSRDAETSQSNAQSWMNLAVNGRSEPDSIVELRFTWSVRALTFWEKWGWLILLILVALLTFIVIYGYIKPYRFPSGLALCFAPAMNELDDQTPQPVRLWRGVGIGFYRDARACLHDTFRIDGKVRGAVAILQAGPRRSVIVKPGSRALYRDVGINEWDQVPPTGRRSGQGEIYRVGDSGPYFRLSLRM